MVRNILVDDRLMEPQGHAIVNRRAERDMLVRELPSGWNLDGVALENPFDSWDEERGGAHFDARVRAWTEEVCRRWPSGRLLVVTHHDWIAAWCRQFQGRDVSVPNAGWFDVNKT